MMKEEKALDRASLIRLREVTNDMASNVHETHMIDQDFNPPAAPTPSFLLTNSHSGSFTSEDEAEVRGVERPVNKTAPW
jgi:hypothetical protein